MGLRDFFKSKTFLANLVVAIVFALLLAGSLQWTLKRFTGHGVVTAVPDVSHLTWESAQTALEAAGLEAEVMDSSSYSQKVPPGTVLEQYPRAGTAVKSGRTVHLTLNRWSPAAVLVPSVIDRSLARGRYDLESKGFIIGEIRRIPDVAIDVILAVECQGVTLPKDTKLPSGSVIDLVVSGGVSSEEVLVPDVIGQTLEQARRTLLSAQFQMGALQFIGMDTISARVIRQNPTGKRKAGESVDLWLGAL